MISAFGVEHGEVSKAFKKLSPKLVKANLDSQKGTPIGRTQSMSGRVRENYSQWRNSAGQTGGSKIGRMMGKPGASTIASAREAKAGARAMVTASGNLNRKQRHLP